jgi:murein DD-endopeptidase MepM/ murein hydrolase activator NlpD
MGRPLRWPWPLLLAVAMLCGGCDGVGSAASRPRPRLEVIPLQLTRSVVHTSVRPGDTIESLCRRLAGGDWVQWRDALLREMDPRSLRPGMAVDGMETSTGRLAELSFELDLRSTVRARATANGVEAHRLDRPIVSTVARVEAEVTSSLFPAVEQAGESPDLAVRLAEIFEWDIDFFRDLRRGDSFVVIVDRQTVDGAFYGYGTIFAARFVNAGRVLNALIYPDGKGRLGYYDLQGRPLRKQFLKAPLKFSRITSRFSPRRFHPILKRPMPHWGVDYGAPVGTPVRVTCDGTVLFVGRKGGAGKMITVRHANGYQTNYLHLSRYAKRIHRGTRVTQGQVIGFVGQTGWATAPHLDYRVRLNGHWINPLRISSPATKPIARPRLKRYLSYALAGQALLDGKEPPVGAAG